MTIQIGIVGCGRILAAHLQGYRRLREAGFDQFRIAALCARREPDALGFLRRDGKTKQRRPVSDRPGDPLAVGEQYISDFQDDTPAVFTDYQTMIASGKVDAVNDFTSHEIHHEVAAAAFASGKHLLTQKPLAVSMMAARQMCRQAAEIGCTFAVFENARNRPATRHLHWLANSGRVGALKMIQLANIGNWWAPNLIVAETPWRHRRADGGGLALDIGVHLFNQFEYIAGEITDIWGQVSIQERERIMGDTRMECDADDTLICGFRSASDVQGSLHLSWSGHGESTMSGDGRGPCFYFEQASVIGDDLQWDDGRRESLARLYDEHADSSLREHHFPRGITDPFALNQLDWLEAIETGRAPETSGEVGAWDLAAALSILESDAAGQRIKVQDVFDGRVREWQRDIDLRFGFGR